MQRLQDAHRCSVCYAAPRNALVSLYFRLRCSWVEVVPLTPLFACCCPASIMAASTNVIISFGTVFHLSIARTVRLLTSTCSQVLPCLHMDVCYECIQKHEQQQRLRDPTGSVTCPMCRAPIRSTMPLPVQVPEI